MRELFEKITKKYTTLQKCKSRTYFWNGTIEMRGDRTFLEIVNINSKSIAIMEFPSLNYFRTANLRHDLEKDHDAVIVEGGYQFRYEYKELDEHIHYCYKFSRNQQIQKRIVDYRKVIDEFFKEITKMGADLERFRYETETDFGDELYYFNKNVKPTPKDLNEALEQIKEEASQYPEAASDFVEFEDEGCIRSIISRNAYIRIESRNAKSEYRRVKKLFNYSPRRHYDQIYKKLTKK